MTRKLLQQITNLATFIFEEQEYNIFMQYIYSYEYTSARLYLDKIIDKLDILVDKLEFLEDNEVLLSQYNKADELMDLIVNLIVNERDTKQQVSTAT